MAIAALEFNCKQDNPLLPFSFRSVFKFFVSVFELLVLFDMIQTETPADACFTVQRGFFS